MKALVTGGTGFVGSHLIETLQRHGHRVRAIVRSATRAEALGLRGVEWLPGDLGDETALRRAVEGVDVVYHVAGLIAARSEADYFEVNREGTRRLLEAAAPTGARFVLVSSLAAGGPTVAGRPLTGDEPPRPVTRYGRSKLAGEEVVKAGPLPWTIIRPPAVYGPRDREFFRLFKAASLGVAPIFGAGDQEMSLVFGPDLAEAIAEAGASAKAVGRSYYAAHPVVTTHADFVRSIARVMGHRVRMIPIPLLVGRGALQISGAIAHLMNRPTVLNADKANEIFQPAWTCDPAHLERDVGWHAAHDLEAGIARTLEWSRQAGWL
jgi:nucleoside-diphosphate-sugar epimerase